MDLIWIRSGVGSIPVTDLIWILDLAAQIGGARGLIRSVLVVAGSNPVVDLDFGGRGFDSRTR